MRGLPVHLVLFFIMNLNFFNPTTWSPGRVSRNENPFDTIKPIVHNAKNTGSCLYMFCLSFSVRQPCLTHCSKYIPCEALGICVKQKDGKSQCQCHSKMDFGAHCETYFRGENSLIYQIPRRKVIERFSIEC